MSRRRDTTSSALPQYVRRTNSAALASEFIALSIIPAPLYEPAPAYIQRATELHAHGSGQGSSHSHAPTNRATMARPRKSLALHAAEHYFKNVLRSERQLDLKKVIDRYKQDLKSLQAYHVLRNIKEPSLLEAPIFASRNKGLKHWINLAIENTVIPELTRREAEDTRIWRSEQRWLNQMKQTDVLHESHAKRVQAIAAVESRKHHVFGDIGTGVRTAGREISEVSGLGTIVQKRAKRIAGLMRDQGDDMLFEFKRLQTHCLARMRATWHSLLDHCIMQISLVNGRAVQFSQQNGHSTERTRVMEALMLHEADNMQKALSELFETFSRSVIERPKEFPPMSTFYKTFNPMTGSALRAAREVTISNGLIYDNAFLKQNNLDAYAADFYDAMRDHLVLLMVEAEIQSSAWREERMRLCRYHTR